MTATVNPGYQEFYNSRLLMMEQTNDQELKDHFQAELDLVALMMGGEFTNDPKADFSAKPTECCCVEHDDDDDPYFSDIDEDDPYFSDIDEDEDEDDKEIKPKPDKVAGEAGNGENTGFSGSPGSKIGPGLPPQAEKYRLFIENASEISGVPANLLVGLIHDESRWVEHAGTVNGGNGLSDSGLVQMNDNTFMELQSKHPELRGCNKNDPETNILAGALYLSDMKVEMQSKYGIDSWDIALRAYNSGPNGVDPKNLSALVAGTGTSNYVDKVTNYWSIVENGGTLPA